MMEIAARMRRAKVAYPADVDTSTLQGRFHLAVYHEVTKLWGENPTGNHDVFVGSFPIFFSAQARRAFLRWWTRYERAFDGGNAPPPGCFFPGVPQGVIGNRPAAFLSAPHTKVDLNIAYVTGIDKRGDHEIDSATWKTFSNIRDQWAWFAAHCRSPVWRVYGGWLFSDASDLARYHLHTEKDAA